MPTIFAIEGAEFADFGAASQSVLALQTALKALGNAAGSATLKAIVTDGLIGPKTTAATNLAFTAHIGPGQAPANFRTGQLSQAEVAANADVLGGLVAREAERRGFNVPTAKVIATVAKVASSKPAVKAVPAPAYVPTSSAAASQAYSPAAASESDDMTMSIVKYSAIGLGLVLAAAGVYYVTKRRPAFAGFGAGGFYHTSSTEFTRGQRVQLHPGTDMWMRGDRYGEVVKTIRPHMSSRDGKVWIKSDSGRTYKLSPSLLEII